jgi:hypothetical protein
MCWSVQHTRPEHGHFRLLSAVGKNAFLRGSEDVAGNGGRPKPLFQRVPGPPLFRSIAETPDVEEKTASAASNSKSKQARNLAAHSRRRR